MRALTVREKWLLGMCLAVIFIIGNAFAGRSVLKVLRGSDAKIEDFRNSLADSEMWLEEAPKAEAREKWLAEAMPPIAGASLGKLQGDLIQSMQDDLFERKLKIDQQSLQDIVTMSFYIEVAVRLTVRGDETEVVEWLTTLQSPERFQIIKAMELELDTKSKEVTPQAICQITIARWYRPDDGEPFTTLEEPLTTAEPAAVGGRQG